MLIKAEIFVEAGDVDENDAQWNTMHGLASHLADYGGIRKVRMPDSPEPDVTGYIDFAHASG